MSSDGEIERRVDALEAETAAMRDRILRMERHNADTRILAAGADREVSTVRDTLRGQQRSIQALHTDVRELQSGLGRVETRLDSLESHMRTGFAMTAAGFAALGDRLDRLAGA
jgi:chromosome segregation ATPase